MDDEAITQAMGAIDRAMGASSDGPSVEIPTDEPPEGAKAANNPADTSLSAVLGELDREGWSGQFMAVEGGTVRCLTCRHEIPADTISADHVRRLEGASDPDDMLIVVPIICPECATRGVLVAEYGPEASAGSADVVAALPRTPATGEDADAGDFPETTA